MADSNLRDAARRKGHPEEAATEKTVQTSKRSQWVRLCYVTFALLAERIIACFSPG